LLPNPCPHVHIIGLLQPFVSAYKIIVTPVVALLTDLSVMSQLVPHEKEVDDVFDHPLEVGAQCYALLNLMLTCAFRLRHSLILPL
jgi:hypothetical protein